MEDQIRMMKSTIDNLGSDEANLKSKIEKKSVELDRAEKRLKSLAGVRYELYPRLFSFERHLFLLNRPAYMDEYEKIEGDLIKFYSSYIEKFRNLTFLEQQLEDVEQTEQNRDDVRILFY